MNKLKIRDSRLSVEYWKLSPVATTQSDTCDTHIYSYNHASGLVLATIYVSKHPRHGKLDISMLIQIVYNEERRNRWINGFPEKPKPLSICYHCRTFMEHLMAEYGKEMRKIHGDIWPEEYAH